MTDAAARPDAMGRALALAREAMRHGEVPVGAVVTLDGAIVGEGRNETRTGHDPTAHAEVVAIREACRRLERDRLDGCDLYVTLEPCTMCAGAISHARIRRVYFGATDEKGGAVESGVRFFERKTCLHRPETYGGIAATEAAVLLRDFFDRLRP